MNSRGYPSTKSVMREKLEALRSLPGEAEEWAPFVRDVMRLPVWILPAVQAAVRQNTWDSAADPLEKIRTSVRGLAIEMRLNPIVK
jgi:hypothetical protein